MGSKATTSADMGPLGWVRNWSRGPRAYFAAVMIGLLEAVIPFITPEVFLIPMLAGAKQRMWLLALCPVLGNLIAALVLYACGAMLAEPVVEPLVQWLGGEAEYQKAVGWLKQDGFMAIFLLDLVPIPVQLVFLAAGVAKFSLPLFLVAIALSRALRYLLIAAVVQVVGKRARQWMEDNQLAIFGVGLLLSIGLGVWMFVSQAAGTGS